MAEIECKQRRGRSYRLIMVIASSFILYLLHVPPTPRPCFFSFRWLSVVIIGFLFYTHMIVDWFCDMVYELERNSFSFASNRYGNKHIDSWQCLGLFPNLFFFLGYLA